MTFSMSVKLENVDQTGICYKGTITLYDLFKGLSMPIIHYCPAIENRDEDGNLDQLYSISNKDIPLSVNKVNEMAVLFLQNKLFWTDVIWNVRKSNDRDSLVYDREKRELTIFNTITIPDSKHRHKAFYQMFQWKNGNEEIPDEILHLDRSEIVDLLDELDENTMIGVMVHNLYPEEEALLFKQMNRLSELPNFPQQTKLFYHEDRTLSFLMSLIEKSSIFSKKEVEMNRITVHKKSRKLVPKSTLETAIKSIIDNVAPLDYDHFCRFLEDFFATLSIVYKELKPTASASERHQSRKESLIINNIMFSPLFQIAYEVWDTYRLSKKDWVNDSYFIKVIEGLSKSITLKDRNGQLHNVNIMSKQNIHWIGKVVNDQHQIINNRISQRIAYDYLSQECKLDKIRKEIAQKV